MEVLKWTYLAERQMTIAELRHALAAFNSASDTFNPDDLPFEKSLVDYCYGLVITDKETSSMRLVHKSLQDFLDRQYTANELFEDGHDSISLTCLKYMIFKDKMIIGSADDEYATIFNLILCSRNIEDHSRRYNTMDSPRLKKYPFLKYAIHFWGELARKTKNQEVLNLVVQFLLKQEVSHYISWPIHLLVLKGSTSSINDGEDCLATDFTPQNSAPHLGAHFGLDGVLNQVLCQFSDIDIDSVFWDKTPLYRAMVEGHESILRLLLANRNFDAATLMSDSHHGSPISCAIEHHRNSIDRLFIKREDISID